METVYLSRRNLLTLLSKLDRRKLGDATNCGIIKHDTIHPIYPCSHPALIVAVEDGDYYTERAAGAVHPLDDPYQTMN